MTTPYFSTSHFLAIAAAATLTAVSRAEATPSATMVTNAVFLPIGVVGVAGTERIDQIAIIPAALVFVPNQQRDRRAGRLSFKHPGENFNGIRLLPLRHMAGGTGLAPIEILLDVFDERARPGGQPSTTQPIAGPWLSPNDVMVKM